MEQATRLYLFLSASLFAGCDSTDPGGTGGSCFTDVSCTNDSQCTALAGTLCNTVSNRCQKVLCAEEREPCSSDDHCKNRQCSVSGCRVIRPNDGDTPISGPRVTASVVVGAGVDEENGPERCGVIPSAQVEIGRAGAPVSNGVSCRVVALEGGKFAVHASAALLAAGSLTVVGTMTAEGTQEDVAVSISPTSIGAFKQNDCTVTLDPGAIAEGRVWGKLECPRIYLSDQDRTCRGFGTFKFENCDSM